MELAWLEDFIVLSREMNFTRAAAARNVTQSAFSRRIRLLEVWTGAKLFDRSSYPVRLTTAGRDFLPIATEIAFTLRSKQVEMKLTAGSGAKFHRFATTHSIAVNHLPSVLTKLRIHCPELQADVVSDNFHACFQQLVSGATDFLLCYLHDRTLLEIDERRFARLDLCDEDLVPVCIPGEHGGPRWQLSEASHSQVPLLAYAEGSFLGTVVKAVLDRQRHGLTVVHRDAYAEALKGMALEGGGVAWLPTVSIRRELHENRLVLAGSAEWSVSLTLAAFSELGSLSSAGTRIWAGLESIAR